MDLLEPQINLHEDGSSLVCEDNVNNDANYLVASCDQDNDDIHMIFSSRVSMYDFAKNLLYESIYGDSGEIELYPLSLDEKLYIVDGVRLSLDSSRIFIKYPKKNKAE